TGARSARPGDSRSALRRPDLAGSRSGRRHAPVDDELRPRGAAAVVGGPEQRQPGHARRLQDLAEAQAPPAELAAAGSDAVSDELVVIDDVTGRIVTVLDVVDDMCITRPTGCRPR
ncbi:MAG: hypothetical protein ABW122_14160, partial [Ilumatobacteraceae bacterium]